MWPFFNTELFFPNLFPNILTKFFSFHTLIMSPKIVCDTQMTIKASGPLIYSSNEELINLFLSKFLQQGLIG